MQVTHRNIYESAPTNLSNCINTLGGLVDILVERGDAMGISSSDCYHIWPRNERLLNF